MADNTSSQSNSPQTPANKTETLIGIKVSINNQPVTITINDLEKAKKDGFAFKLPEPIELGSFEDLVTWLDTQFKLTLNDELGSQAAKELPDPLNTIVMDIENLDFKLEKFDFNLPPKSSTKKKTYTLQLGAKLPQPVDLISGSLAIDGFVFGVSNEGGLDNSENSSDSTDSGS